MQYFSENELVVPGQILSDNPRQSGFGTYVREGKVYASVMGFAKSINGVLRIIPVSGRYRPQRGDKVLGIVSDVKPNAVEVDIGGETTAVIKPHERETTPLKIDIGDCVLAEVKATGLKGIVLATEGLQKIPSGILISVNAAKVPRIIGRKGSMLQVLRRETGCDFWVGRNGLIVVNGPDPAHEFAAVAAVNMIEREAHTSGLTERVIQMLRKMLGRGDEDSSN
ncbi:MAG: exosome complex protein Rrp4 [Candidatus Caldarchaeum sp.]|jgi:exosome complex component RRP4|uniref:RNA-binding protein n=1 Tax=Caldiarchaeum subterraneum TaxID=311458 RepID=A0A7C4E343_CALS0|nr:exosome complex protein Rrp4 [Candidatus Caldarchaeales archaeon]